MLTEELKKKYTEIELKLHPDCKKLIAEWENVKEKYSGETFDFSVRGKLLKLPFAYQSLSGTSIKKVYLPRYSDWGDILKWQLQENVPGEFPYTAGVFPLKREGEDPTRMFAGEGGPERTNKRFHYVSAGQPAIRLSTAFD
ncbi:MAG TPA: methylmalonyl-CoA mutase family protein, partial [Chitinophagales bacterium]|nr:methylmalonyl-CoA mutase family protein [Chitinophagales bacterium]